MIEWWVRQDLNLWPLPCRGSALPLSYSPTNKFNQHTIKEFK